MDKFCDLHTHSIFSDGTWTPEEIVEEAERLGLSAVALCDHNSIEGLPRFMAAARGKSVRAVPGIEFSTEYQGLELHILGLMVEPEHYDRIRAFLREYLLRKAESGRELVDALCRGGYMLDYDKIAASTPNGNVNRAHIAAELTRLQMVGSVKEAFATLLDPKAGYYKPIKKPDALETVAFIRELSAVPVLAHAFRSMQEPQLLAFLEEAVPCGLGAMETLYSTYDEETTRLSEEIADRFGLIHSGGTDFHGDKKPDIHLGTGRGGLAVPYDYLLRLDADRQEHIQ